MDNKNQSIKKPMLQGVAVISIFYVIEIVMVYLNLFPDNNVLLLDNLLLLFLNIYLPYLYLKELIG